MTLSGKRKELQVREIKFRAWMKPAEEIPHKMFYNFWPGATWHPTDPRCPPIMQYTGLKDSNGVNVYESDIIRCWMKEDLANDYRGYVSLVEWDSCHLMYVTKQNKHKPFEFGEYSQQLSCIEEVCVIGNIYENPELLENKK